MSNDKQRCVIIGAGRTGRGFLAPLVDHGGWEFSFVDQDQNLVEHLSTGETTVRHFGDQRSPWRAEPGSAHLAGSASAEAALARADLVLTAVGAGNMSQVAAWLTEWAGRQASVPPVIACENGIDVTRPFREMNYPAPAVQAAVFCTSTNDPRGDELALESEDVSSIPFDARQGDLRVPSTFEPRHDFDVLMQRKLYTYNALTAVIAYPGSLLGSEWLAEAASLESVAELIDVVRSELDRTLQREFGLTAEDQSAFTERALAKFRNPAIQDPVARNTRDVVRKLAPHERIVAPMLLAHKHGVDPRGLSTVLAVAIEWGRRAGEITDVGALQCWEELPATDRQRVSQVLPDLQVEPLTDDHLIRVLASMN